MGFKLSGTALDDRLLSIVARTSFPSIWKLVHYGCPYPLTRTMSQAQIEGWKAAGPGPGQEGSEAGAEMTGRAVRTLSIKKVNADCRGCFQTDRQIDRQWGVKKRIYGSE